MEQKHSADIFAEALDYLWNGLGMEEKDWKRLKKGDFKKRAKNGLTYLIWFERRRYNYLDYENSHGSVEVGFHYTIYHGDDLLYSFDMEAPTGGAWFQLLTEDLRLNAGLLDAFLPLIKAHYLDFIDSFEVDPPGALQPVCAPFIQPEDYSWRIHVREQMVERYGTLEQLAEYQRQEELRKTPESKVRQWMGSQIFHFSHDNCVNHAWAASRTVEELDMVVGNHVRAKKLYDIWTDEDEAGYQFYLQEQDMEKRTYRAWYLIANPRKLPKEIVNQELAFRFKLFLEKKEETK